MKCLFPLQLFVMYFTLADVLGVVQDIVTCQQEEVWPSVTESIHVQGFGLTSIFDIFSLVHPEKEVWPNGTQPMLPPMA